MIANYSTQVKTQWASFLVSICQLILNSKYADQNKQVLRQERFFHVLHYIFHLLQEKLRKKLSNCACLLGGSDTLAKTEKMWSTSSNRFYIKYIFGTQDNGDRG